LFKHLVAGEVIFRVEQALPCLVRVPTEVPSVLILMARIFGSRIRLVPGEHPILPTLLIWATGHKRSEPQVLGAHRPVPLGEHTSPYKPILLGNFGGGNRWVYDESYA